MKFILKTIFFGAVVSILVSSFTWLVALTAIASLHILRFDIEHATIVGVALTCIGLGSAVFVAWIIYLVIQVSRGYKAILNKNLKVEEK